MQAIPKADLVEVFSSLQGEGVLTGARQVFLRFPDCNLDCNYCDTDFALKDGCRVEEVPASGILSEWKNPIGIERISTLIQHWQADYPRAHHSLSLTGGEPLLHTELLECWLPQLKGLLPLYLETNGTLPEQLKRIVEHLAWVSMDIKLHSLSGERTDWATHRKFLETAIQTQVFVKLVVSEETPDLELQLAGDLVAGISNKIPLILQPLTIANKPAVSSRHLLHMQAVAADAHRNVRVIPQTHIFMMLA